MINKTTINTVAAEAAALAARTGWDHAIVINNNSLTVALAQGTDVAGEIARARGWGEPLGGNPDASTTWALEALAEDLAEDVREAVLAQWGTITA